MSDRNTSADSFSEFFASSKAENVNDENKFKQRDTPNKSAIATLIKSQPVLHRRTPLDSRGKILFQSFNALHLGFSIFTSNDK